MSIKYPKIPHNYVPEYQQSSIPWVTASSLATADLSFYHARFPTVTRWIQVHNGDHAGNAVLRFGFSLEGVDATADVTGVSGSNYFELHAGEKSDRLELKCTDLYLMTDTNTTPFNIIAGLTNIQRDAFPVLTGSNGFQGVG
jgi:hypothetical protein